MYSKPLQTFFPISIVKIPTVKRQKLKNNLFYVSLLYHVWKAHLCSKTLMAQGTTYMWSDFQNSYICQPFISQKIKKMLSLIWIFLWELSPILWLHILRGKLKRKITIKEEALGSDQDTSSFIWVLLCNVQFKIWNDKTSDYPQMNSWKHRDLVK